MFEYILVIGISVVLGVFSLSSNDKKAQQGMLFLFVLFCGFIVGVRDMIGGYDVYNYVSYFESCPTIDELLNQKKVVPIFQYEPLYFLLNVILKTLFPNKYFLLFATAMISYTFLYLAVKDKKYMGVVLLLLLAKFFIVSFIYIRQFIAIPILWFALTHYGERDKPYRYALWVIIASLFHFSSLIALLILPFRKSYLSQKVIALLLVGSLFLGMIGILKPIGLFLGGTIGDEKLLSYSSAEVAEMHILYLLEALLLGIFLFLQYKTLRNSLSPLYLNIFVFYLVGTLLTLREPALLRLQWFFYWGAAVALPSMFSKFSIKDLRGVLLTLLFIYATAFYFRNVTLRDGGDFLPYKAFFQDRYRIGKFD